MDIASKIEVIFAQAEFLMPEIILLAGSILILLLDLVIKGNNRPINLSIFFLLLFLTGGAMFTLTPWEEPEAVTVWGVLIIDKAALFFQTIFLGATAIYAISYWKRASALDYFLALSLLLGSFLVVKSVNLMVLLLGVEILSISAYAFTAKQSTESAKEAGLKYIIFGAVSTAIFLFGVSLLYGITGELTITTELFVEQLIIQDGIVLLFVFLFVLAGLFFKITAFPFHLWAPDVYQSIPAPLAGLFSIVPKIAVVGFMIKFFIVINTFGIVDVPWEELLGGIAIITMTIGNLAALSQQNPQRMMAYSSIAHTGFFLMGIVAFHQFAFQSVLFYSSVYLFMNMLAFLLVDVYQRRYKVNEIRDFAGKITASSFLGIFLVVVMISLTGLPPTAGFTAKLFIFSAVWQTYQETESSLYLILMVAGIFNTVLSLFYYLKIPYFLIFRKQEDGLIYEKRGSDPLNFLLIVLVLPLLILFIWPDLLMDWINMVNFAL